MSTVKANSFLDGAGGNTATINGITPALASQAEAEAGTDNTKLMTPLRASQAIAALAPAPTTTEVLDATAGATAGGVGTYVFARNSGTVTVAFGGTVAGSALTPVNIGVSGTSSTSIVISTTTAQTGTWRCMGYSLYANNGADPDSFGVTLWLRIS